MLNFSEIESCRNRTENLDELWEQMKQKIGLMEKQLKQKDIIIETQKGRISTIESKIVKTISANFRKKGERKTCFYIESCS